MSNVLGGGAHAIGGTDIQEYLVTSFDNDVNTAIETNAAVHKEVAKILKEKFPKLIHCRISGFGAKGPLGGAPGYDAIVQAMTGMMSVNGHADGGDVRIGAPVVDMGTGLYSTIGILMALQEREKSGLGQFLDMSLYDSALALMHPHTGNYFLSKKPKGGRNVAKNVKRNCRR